MINPKKKKLVKKNKNNYKKVQGTGIEPAKGLTH